MLGALTMAVMCCVSRARAARRRRLRLTQTVEPRAFHPLSDSLHSSTTVAAEGQREVLVLQRSEAAMAVAAAAEGSAATATEGSLAFRSRRGAIRQSHPPRASREAYEAPTLPPQPDAQPDENGLEPQSQSPPMITVAGFPIRDEADAGGEADEMDAPPYRVAAHEWLPASDHEAHESPALPPTPGTVVECPRFINVPLT